MSTRGLGDGRQVEAADRVGPRRASPRVGRGPGSTSDRGAASPARLAPMSDYELIEGDLGPHP